MKKNKIVFIYQNAFSQTGGIQTFNKRFINALEDISKKNSNLYIKIMSIYDKKDDIKTNLDYVSLNKSKLKAFIFILKNAFNFDVFIFAHVNLAPLAVLLHILNPKAKIIFCTHGIEVWKKLPKSTEWIMNKSVILTVSNFSKKELLKFNPKLKEIKIFPNCININEEDNFLQNPYNEKNYNILSVSRLDTSEKLKGIDNVIKALPLISKQVPNIKYTIIGKGNDVSRLKYIAKKFHVEKYVNFLGFVSDIDSYYRYCDIFILPSKKEGFGIVYLEAMLYKKPVIAVNYGGVPDVVIDNKTGYLCEYNDIKCIAEKVIYLYKNPEISCKLGENGYKRLMNNFTFEHFKNNLEKILKEVMSK
jgi:phosphatidylinositol alpha-1,6-mannosyltransferase